MREIDQAREENAIFFFFTFFEETHKLSNLNCWKLFIKIIRNLINLVTLNKEYLNM